MKQNVITSELTPEQTAEFEKRAADTNEKITQILKDAELEMVALPAFSDIGGGRCVAVGMVRLQDLKYIKKPVLETDPSDLSPVEGTAQAAVLE